MKIDDPAVQEKSVSEVHCQNDISSVELWATPLRRMMTEHPPGP